MLSRVFDKNSNSQKSDDFLAPILETPQLINHVAGFLSDEELHALLLLSKDMFPKILGNSLSDPELVTRFYNYCLFNKTNSLLADFNDELKESIPLQIPRWLRTYGAMTDALSQINPSLISERFNYLRKVNLFELSSLRISLALIMFAINKLINTGQVIYHCMLTDSEICNGLNSANHDSLVYGLRNAGATFGYDLPANPNDAMPVGLAIQLAALEYLLLPEVLLIGGMALIQALPYLFRKICPDLISNQQYFRIGNFKANVKSDKLVNLYHANSELKITPIPKHIFFHASKPLQQILDHTHPDTQTTLTVKNNQNEKQVKTSLVQQCLFGDTKKKVAEINFSSTAKFKRL